MAADIDVRSIAAFASLPEATVSTILDEPTRDLVKSLLEAVQKKARDFDLLKSDKTKVEVEHETFVRTNESKAKVLQNTRDKALADISKLRVDLQSAENARSRIESELDQVKQSTTNEATEIIHLKSRISSLETSNRDTLSLLESKNAAYDRQSQELSTHHAKVVELRKQVSTLEQASQTASSALASARFREQSLEQELSLTKKNNEWLENERKIKADEHSSFRKEKNAKISELTRYNEQHIEEVESLRRSESALKARVGDQVNKNEELLRDIQKFREKEITDADSYRIELDSVNRLAQLQEASATTAKQRVRELEQQLDDLNEDTANEIGHIRAEVEAEHSEREAAEQHVVELEARVAELENELDQSKLQQPVTPRKDVNSNGFSTPLRPSTPTGVFTPSLGGRFKGASGNLTISQLYGEYKKLEADLASERRINGELQSNIDAMLEDLETKRPEIEEIQEDQRRLQSEVLEMSALVDRANSERDDAVKHARILQGRFDATSKELAEYQQSVRDRNSQLRWMIMDREARDRGGSLSEAEFQNLQRAAAEADARDSEHLTETQRIVNEQLVLFRSVAELQQQNENQLMTIRNLVNQLETAEAKEIQQMNHQLKEELEAARAKIDDYQAEIKHMVAQSKSFVKERDMFKNMLTKRGHLVGQVDPADFSRSMPLPTGGPPLDAAGAAPSGSSDYAKLLKDLQTHFDNYRQETATDTSSLRNQVSDMTKRNSQLQTESSRVVGQLTAANQRFEMLQANFNMLKSENSEIQKRSYAAMETATKQEMKTAQAAEELVEAKGLLDSMRRETANLKAEKDLNKSVEKRLIEDNESLRNERARLDSLNASLQNILNEREQADSETRRRLQAQVEVLENELTSTKRKLTEELEDSKKTSLRREYEHEQNQRRIDDLVTSLGTTREELASAKTARDHLQARVDELTVELRSAEERIEVITKPANDMNTHASAVAEETLSREQELAVEISELKRDLELKTAELDRANEQIEVYKSIAQSAEERLQELSETNDQFREETEASIAERDATIKNLEQRAEDISAELTTNTSELTKLRDEQSESNRKLDEQKNTFEIEIARLKDAEEKSFEQAQFNLEASKAQADIAQEAQQNYENELVRHAEAAKNLHIVRAEANQLRLEMVNLKTQAENVHNDLEQKETSWSELKDRYERELLDLRRRRDELAQQNALLHGQLESLTQQITALQRDRAALADSESVKATDESNKDRTDLQEVIKYLRREKEIVDVQYHLSTQEAKRLRQQLDFSQSQLDDTRLKLDQQQRQDADSERNAMSHKKLMDTLNELNLFRESSVTLRAEAKQATQTLAEKTRKLEELESQIQPLQARISELENLAELREGEMKLLQDDRDHWQQRCQNILSKYDRVDPAELESLKSRVVELEKERDDVAAAQVELQAQIDAHPVQVEQAKSELKARLAEQFKGRSQTLTARIKDKQNEVDTATAERDSLQIELDSMKEQLEAVKAQIGTADMSLQGNTGPSEAADTSTQSSATIADLQSRISELEAELTEKDEQIQSAGSTHEENFKAKETQLKEMLNKRLSEVKQQLNTAKEAALDELRQKLTTDHQQEIETLRSQSVPVAPELPKSPENSLQADGETLPAVASFEALIESITEPQARQLVQKNSIIRSIVATNIKKRVELEKENLRKELATNSAPTIEGEAISPDEAEKSFAAEKEKIVREKEEEFAKERDAMTKDFEERVESERQRLIAQKDEELASERLQFSAESEQKIAEQVANAQALVEKRVTVKLNMAQNQARAATAKLEVVSKAADETPEKAVKEVWEVAKVAKAAPQQTKPAVPPSPTVNQTSSPPQIATDTAAEVAKVEETPTTATTGTPKPVQAVASIQPKSSIPQTRGGSRGGRGGGIPVPAQQAQAGQATRGSGIPRGGARGRGTGRGAAQSSIPATASTRGGNTTGSPGRGNLNPSAQQFTPSGKRAREDGDSSTDGTVGKKIRGGAQGGA